MTIILNCLPFIITSNTYVSAVFLLAFVFSLIYRLLRV